MGPVAWILLARRLSSEQAAYLETTLRGADRAYRSLNDFHVWSTRHIGGTFQAVESAEASPFIAAIGMPGLETEEIEALKRAFGFPPVAVIELIAMCNARHDHRVLGELALHFAECFNGVIDFCGDLGIQTMPQARLVNIGRGNPRHVGDAKFLKSWLRDERFFMVK
jgi:hypothetical protein